MGDSTYGQLSVYDVPLHQVAAFYNVLVDEGLQASAGHCAHVRLGAPGYQHRCSVGWMFDDAVPDALVAAAPDAVWLGWEDPAAGHLGTLRVHAPGLGMFVADCDSEGLPVFSTDEMRAVAADPAAVDRLVGTPWFTRIAELRAALDRSPRAIALPDPHSATEDSGPGELVVEDAGPPGDGLRSPQIIGRPTSPASVPVATEDWL
jgi:hypothetical protein